MIDYPHGGAGEIWRDEDGASGLYRPDKGEIRDWGGVVEQALDDATTDLASATARVGAAEASIASLQAAQVAGLLLYETWAELQAATGATDGEGAEVMDTDAGTHSAATATGYDGATVNNAGRYRWDAGWSRWVRVGDTGLAGVSAGLTALQSTVFLAPGADVTLGYAGDASAAVPDGGLGSDNNIVFLDQVPLGGSIVQVELYCQIAGDIIVRAYDAPDGLDPGDTVTPVAEQTVTCAAGYNQFTVDVPFAAGQYVGLYSPAGVLSKEGAVGPTVAFGGNASFAAFTVANQTSTTFVAKVTYNAPAQSVTARIDAIDATLVTVQTDLDRIDELEGIIFDDGASPVALGYVGDVSDAVPDGGLGSNNNIVHLTAMPDDGVIERIDIHVEVSGYVIVRAYDAPNGLAAGQTVTPYASQSVFCAIGVNSIAVNVPFKAGHYIGFYSPAGVVSKEGVGGPTVAYGGGSAATAFTVSNQIDTNFVAQVTYRAPAEGLEARIEALESEVAGLGAADAVGFKLPAMGELALPTYLFAGVSGQSNARGSSPAITLSAEYAAQGFDNLDTVVQSLGATIIGGNEYPGFGAARYLREAIMFGGGPSHLDPASQIIMGRAAQGGTVIADLDTGSAVYTANLAQLSAAATAGGANPFRHLGQMWFQGEADAEAPTAEATYKALLLALATDYDTDSRTAVAGSYARPTFAIQMTSAVGYAGADGWAIARAQFEAARESALISMVGPCYQIPFADDRHLTSEGYRIAGALFARAMFLHAATGALFEPLQAVETRIEGNDIVLRYNRTGLVIDTAGVPAQTDYGFAAHDGVSAVTIDSVNVAGNEVRLTCATTPLAGWTWSYGNLSAAGLSPYAGGAGNIRDAAGARDEIDGVPLHNWAVLQDGTL